MSLCEIERIEILETYRTLGTVKAAAEMLGISERKMHYRLKEYRQAEHAKHVASPNPASPNPASPNPASPNPASPSPAGPSPTSPGPTSPGPSSASVVPPEPAARRAARVIIAEDDDELRWALGEFLRTEGYDVTAVADGQSLMSRLDDDAPLGAGAPDLILADLRMPGATGIEVLESVRRHGWRLPVILMSAFGDDAVRGRAAALGAAAFLDKPIDIGELQAMLEDALPK
jgi:DNA-binding NtrC family response regulator